LLQRWVWVCLLALFGMFGYTLQQPPAIPIVTEGMGAALVYVGGRKRV